MFKTALAVASIPVGFVALARESRRQHKLYADLAKQEMTKTEEIAASIAKIGSYKPVAYVPVVWA